MTIQIIDGLGEIAERYGLFVIDQWGVLHDGVTAHPGAVDAMENLRRQADRTGAGIALLSNSGKRVEASYERLEALGIGRHLYDLIVTSGEEVHRGLSQRGRDDAEDPFYGALGPRFYGFWWDDDRGILEGCNVEEVTDVGKADFILCSGTDKGELDAYRPVLERALKMCPGAVAEAYEVMGGRVRWHGKPQPEVYTRIREHFGSDARGIGIGDSLQHDIKGAEESGLDGLFIAGGIHRDDLDRPLVPDQVKSRTVSLAVSRASADLVGR